MVGINTVATVLSIRYMLRREQRPRGAGSGATAPQMEEPAPPAPSRPVEELAEADLGRRSAAPVVCYYVQGGKKMHIDKTCCGMGNPQQVQIPAAALPFVAWCRLCAARLNPR